MRRRPLSNGRQLLRDNGIWLGAVAGLLLGCCIFLGCLPGPSSTTLFVHSDSPITVESGGIGSLAIALPDGSVRVAPLRHGPKLLGIHFAHGETLWVTFFCLDVGARKRMDIFVVRSPNGQVTIRQTVNQRETVFTGTVHHAADTSRDKPFRLEWI